MSGHHDGARIRALEARVADLEAQVQRLVEAWREMDENLAGLNLDRFIDKDDSA